MEGAAERRESSAVDALWLGMLQRIVGRASHEVKGALNGVSVNLEVVRSRAEKPDVPAMAVSRFAQAAAGQLEELIAMTEAMLSLAREAREPVELGLLLDRFGALLGPAARADGRTLVLDRSLGDLGVTSANGTVVRLVVGEALLAVLERSTSVQCRAAESDGPWGASIRVDGGISNGSGAVSVDPDIAAAVTDAGIQVVADSSGLLIMFPR